jgi:hypothetical protein
VLRSLDAWELAEAMGNVVGQALGDNSGPLTGRCWCYRPGLMKGIIERVLLAILLGVLAWFGFKVDTQPSTSTTTTTACGTWQSHIPCTVSNNNSP